MWLVVEATKSLHLKWNVAILVILDLSNTLSVSLSLKLNSIAMFKFAIYKSAVVSVTKITNRKTNKKIHFQFRVSSTQYIRMNVCVSVEDGVIDIYFLLLLFVGCLFSFGFRKYKGRDWFNRSNQKQQKNKNNFNVHFLGTNNIRCRRPKVNDCVCVYQCVWILTHL